MILGVGGHSPLLVGIIINSITFSRLVYCVCFVKNVVSNVALVCRDDTVVNRLHIAYGMGSQKIMINCVLNVFLFFLFDNYSIFSFEYLIFEVTL